MKGIGNLKEKRKKSRCELEQHRPRAGVVESSTSKISCKSQWGVAIVDVLSFSLDRTIAVEEEESDDHEF